jgi:hypothetical protein
MTMAHQAEKIMLPVPAFILSPCNLHRQNEDRMFFVIRSMVSDVDFIKKIGIDRDRLKEILLIGAGFELWKRGWAMRIQWIFQVIAIIMFWQILWLIF